MGYTAVPLAFMQLIKVVTLICRYKHSRKLVRTHLWISGKCRRDQAMCPTALILKTSVFRAHPLCSKLWRAKLKERRRSSKNGAAKWAVASAASIHEPRRKCRNWSMVAGQRVTFSARRRKLVGYRRRASSKIKSNSSEKSIGKWEMIRPSGRPKHQRTSIQIYRS